MQYSLGEGLSWCVCADRTVFLDLPRDRYFCLPQTEDDAFRQWAAGDGIGEARLQRLVERRLLEPCEKPPLVAPACVEPMICDLGADRDGKPHLIDLLGALLTQRRMQLAVRRRPIAEIVMEVPRLTARRAQPAALAEARRVANALAATALLVRKADRCLPRALAACAICSRLGLPSKLVFGVRLEPFAAHCWVQWEGAVIVGDLEQARMFTPILVVP